MATAFNTRKRIRRFFGHIESVAPMPNLIEVQKSSYETFLQRMIPAALDVVTTGGSFFPAAGRGDLWLIFAHKAWAMVVLILGSVLALRSRRGLAAHPGVRRLALTVPVLLGCQVTLGISVLLTMDRFKLPPSTTLVQMKLSPVFWVTNLHVLTGLGILACAFTLVVKLIAAVPHRGKVTTQSGESTGLPK